MHPAYSVIIFTVLSGAGYGLLCLLGLAALSHPMPRDPGYAIALFGAALLLVSAGLLSSTAHLGRPERAWRAFSQWRSSWLSREGVLAVVTYPVALAFALGWILNNRGLELAGAAGTVILTAATVMATAMIYASLKPIRQWHNGWVLLGYAMFALMSGAVWLQMITRLFGYPAPALGWIAVVILVLGLLVKLGYWRFIDREASPATAASATGLGKFGTVRLLEPPHTEENYLQKEMGFRVARKHAAKLRRISVAAAFVLPLAASVATLLSTGWLAAFCAILAAISCTLGLLIERWLFFAEAKHTVTLYYGASTA